MVAPGQVEVNGETWLRLATPNGIAMVNADCVTMVAPNANGCHVVTGGTMIIALHTVDEVMAALGMVVQTNRQTLN